MMAPVELRLADDEKRFGGKSVQLGASLRAGLPVPPGWALSVDFVAAIVSADTAAIATLKSFLSDKPQPFAVRSSGVGEDASIASFAGQHFTELNRIGLDEIVEALHLVWASGHSDGARAYRERLGITEKARTAVALQNMVFPDTAGVMFTKNPLNGADERVIEAAWGLGEAVVAGLVIPDTYRIARDGTVLERSPGLKRTAIRRRPEGGTFEEDVAPERTESLSLDDAALAQLNALATRCEEVYGADRDIEWAFADGELYLLQCRAITKVGT